jgi:hypothetical protein
MSNSAGNGRARRAMVVPTGDRVAFVLGVAFTLIMLWVFTSRMRTNLTRDRALEAVPASTPTPPPPPPPTGH